MKRSFLCSGSVVAVSTAFLLVACGGDTIGDTIVIPVGDGGPTVDATTDAAPPTNDATVPDAATPDSGDDDASPVGDDAGQDSGQMDAGHDAAVICSLANCASPMICANNACVAPTCTDGTKDGSETGQDCGGSCAPGLTCANGLGCAANSDCTNGACITQADGTTKLCEAPTCSDGVVDQGETGSGVTPVTPATNTECGGANCPACPDTFGCAKNTDCVDKICTIAAGAMAGTCAAPTCTDGTQNGTETGTDCGNAACGACGGTVCITGATCASGICTQGKCVAVTAETCNDGAKNGTETGVDCGGTCGACAAAACAQTSDCNLSDVCTASVCVAATSCDAILTAHSTATSGCTRSSRPPRRPPSPRTAA